MDEFEDLLASDLDGTLIPPSPSRDATRGVAALSRAAKARPALGLSYVTGRHFQLALRGIQEWNLPRPDYLVCDVGTSVYRRSGRGFTADEDYRALMESAMGARGVDVRAALRGLPGLEPQEGEKQADFKASFYAPPGEDGRAAARRARRVLARSSIRAAVVASHDVTADRTCIDVLPESVAKDRALRYLQTELDLGVDRIVYAGDSGNDREVMLSGYPSVLVANAPPDLRDELRRAAGERGLESRIYFARRPYAAGVLEGCAHFGIL